MRVFPTNTPFVDPTSRTRTPSGDDSISQCLRETESSQRTRSLSEAVPTRTSVPAKSSWAPTSEPEMTAMRVLAYWMSWAFPAARVTSLRILVRAYRMQEVAASRRQEAAKERTRLSCALAARSRDAAARHFFLAKRTE